MQYEWILFDADGTLFDYDRAEYETLRETFHELIGEFAPDYAGRYSRINDEVWLLFEQGEVTPERLRTLRFERLFAELNVTQDPAEFSQHYMENLSRHTELISGAEELLNTLKGQINMMLITNGLSQVQRERYAKSILPGYMQDMVVSEEVGAAKPAPEIFREAFRRMGKPEKETVLMVGDSLSSDVKGANTFGIDVCWFDSGDADPPEDVEIQHRITRLTELSQIVRQHSNGEE